MAHRLPILLYHGVDDTGSVVSTSPARFAWQMAHLHRSGVRVLPLGDLVAGIERAEPLPARALALTFDDGLASVYERAWPILARYGFPATVFVVAGHCGGHNDWPGQPAGVPSSAMLSWSQVRELDRHGIAIGSHSLDHPRLDRLSPADLEAQVRAGRAVLQDQLGHDVRHFAYPYGRHTADVRRCVGRWFGAACTARPGLVAAGGDLLRLPRVEVAYLDPPALFARMGGPWFPAYLGARRALRAVAGRLLNRAWA